MVGCFKVEHERIKRDLFSSKPIKSLSKFFTQYLDRDEGFA